MKYAKKKTGITDGAIVKSSTSYSNQSNNIKRCTCMTNDCPGYKSSFQYRKSISIILANKLKIKPYDYLMEWRECSKFNADCDKNSTENKNRRTYQRNKLSMTKPLLETCLNGEKVESIFPKLRNKTEILTLSCYYCFHSSGNLCIIGRTKK